VRSERHIGRSIRRAVEICRAAAARSGDLRIYDPCLFVVIKSDRFRSALATLQPMLTGITGGRCEPCGRSLSASNLFHRIEHAVPFVSAHDTISEEAPSQAWSGKRRMCSPGLACDPSSGHMLASTARLVAAVQGLQGPGSRPVPLRAAHDPDRPTAVVRLTLRCETSLTWHCELRAAATTLLRRGRAFVCLECASRGWLGSIRRPEATCAADKGERTPMAVLVLRQALGAASCGGLVCVPWIIAIESK
jgi:hypothetical protein